MEIRSHSFSKYAKFFEKLPFLTPWYAHVTKWMTLSNLECTRLWIWNVNAPFLCSTYCGTCTTSRWCYFPIVKPNFIVENDFNFLTYNLKIYHHVFTFQYCCTVLPHWCLKMHSQFTKATPEVNGIRVCPFEYLESMVYMAQCYY